MPKGKEGRRSLLPAFLCAQIFIERETSGYEAGLAHYDYYRQNVSVDSAFWVAPVPVIRNIPTLFLVCSTTPGGEWEMTLGTSLGQLKNRYSRNRRNLTWRCLLVGRKIFSLNLQQNHTNTLWLPAIFVNSVNLEVNKVTKGSLLFAKRITLPFLSNWFSDY